MKRLWSTLILDLRNQYRMGLAALLVVITILAVVGIRLEMIPIQPSQMAPCFVGILMAELFLINCFQFAREKAVGTLTLLRVTPLRPHEYLVAKVGNSLVLGLGQAFVFGISTIGIQSEVIPVLGAIVLLVPIAVLAGFVLATTINNKFWLWLACFSTLILFTVPWIVNKVPDAKFWSMIHPLQPALTLLESMGGGNNWAACVIAIGVECFWLTIALLACKKSLSRVGNQGPHRYSGATAKAPK